MPSYAAYFKTRLDTEFTTNALRFATQAEAESYARDLFGRWLGASEWEVRPHQDKPSHTFIGYTLDEIRP